MGSDKIDFTSRSWMVDCLLQQLAQAIYVGLERRFGFVLETDNLAMQAACLDPRYGHFAWLPEKYNIIMNEVHSRYVVFQTIVLDRLLTVRSLQSQ
jgi:hypothetical protein